MIDRYRDRIIATPTSTSERRISAPYLEKFSGWTKPCQTVPATLLRSADRATMIGTSTTRHGDGDENAQTFWPKRSIPREGKLGPRAERRGFSEKHGELLRLLNALTAALLRNRSARHSHQAARARTDMREWQVQRRARKKHLIELGGLVIKSGVVELTGDDRALILG